MAAFVNEPYLDFTKPENSTAARAAWEKVRADLGKEYDLLIAGERRTSQAKLPSVNPSKPSEIVGVHQKGSPQDAIDAVEAAHAYLQTWGDVPFDERADYLVKIAAIIRQRKLEFDAWLVLEAGKTWAEAEADVAEAIDFCEYYARRACKLAKPEPLVQLNGERDEMVYLPLGVGVVIPPWNFPLAIMVGMTVAALVTGNTVVLKPSSETPTIAAKFAEVLLEAGVPPRSILARHRQRRGHRRHACCASQNSVCFVHRVTRSGPAHQRTRRQNAEGADLDQASDRRDGR